MLASALLHASWNAWVKSRPDPAGALTALVIGASWPSTLLLLYAGPPSPAAWPWIAITIALSVPAQRLLGRAYREGDFAVAYPLLRGLNPLIVAVAGVPVFGERLPLANLLGVLCVAGGIALLGWEASQRSRTITLRGLGFALLAAAIGASGLITDSHGARIADAPLSYGSACVLANGLAMAPVAARRERLSGLMARHLPEALFLPLLSTTSYVLAVWSLSRAPVALVVSLRETSMFFALAIAVLWLRERIGLLRWLAVGFVFVGVLLIRS
jgi:drug/metabolite transporter (DMT)-like permease